MQSEGQGLGGREGLGETAQCDAGKLDDDGGTRGPRYLRSPTATPRLVGRVLDAAPLHSSLAPLLGRTAIIISSYELNVCAGATGPPEIVQLAATPSLQPGTYHGQGKVNK